MKLTEMEKYILKEMHKQGYIFVARNSDGELIWSDESLCKDAERWCYSQILPNYILDFASNLFKFIKWEDEEPWRIVELLEASKPKLTETEKYILKEMSNNFYWVARDKNGELFWSVGEPKKNFEGFYWQPTLWLEEGCDYIRIFNDLFKFIQWTDDEPRNIKELLK